MLLCCRQLPFNCLDLGFNVGGMLQIAECINSEWASHNCRDSICSRSQVSIVLLDSSYTVLQGAIQGYAASTKNQLMQLLAVIWSDFQAGTDILIDKRVVENS